MTESRKYFGADGVIRGTVNKDFTPDLAIKIGQATGIFFLRNNGRHRHQVVVGKDTSLRNYTFENAVISGFTSVGMDVYPTGPVPQPAISMLAPSMRCDIGVMIATPEPGDGDIGISLFGPDGERLRAEHESEIEKILGDPVLIKKGLARDRDLGRAQRIDGASERYVESVKSKLPKDLKLDGMRVVIDCAHGAAYKVGPKALEELGAETIKIGVEPDGLNINLDLGVYAPKALRDKVREMRADVGIALDGSGSRAVIVDENGLMFSTERILKILHTCWPDRWGKEAKPEVTDPFLLALQLLAVAEKVPSPSQVKIYSLLFQKIE